MRPVADPDKLIKPPGVEAAAVLPLNLFVPAAMFAVTDTSFQGCDCVSTVCIFVKLPVIAADPKFTEIEALPTAVDVRISPLTGL